MNERQQRLLSRSVDIVYSALWRRRPDDAGLSAARIVAHRGHTGIAGAAAENTLAAFAHCQALGLYGVELDVQWTRDGVPVVFHDADTARIFGVNGVVIADTRFDALRERFPSIPTLAEVVGRFGARLHLMIELKTETFATRHRATLYHGLSGLEAAVDYHLLCLEPEALATLDGVPADARIAVAETNTRAVADAVRRLGLTRMAGHYLLFSAALRRELAANGIRFGVGMVPGRNVLCREIHRGCEWIFTNHGARLARCLERMRAAAGR